MFGLLGDGINRGISVPSASFRFHGPALKQEAVIRRAVIVSANYEIVLLQVDSR